MRAIHLLLVTLLTLGLMAQAQEKPPEESPPQKPTLGPAPAPSLHGPRSSTTTDVRKLARVRRIYIERIDNALSEELMDGLGKTRRFQIVADSKQADAVLRGTCFESRRLKMVRSEVYLNERVTGASIWQDNVRRPYNPPPLSQAVHETATLVLEHLAQSILEAERR